MYDIYIKNYKNSSGTEENTEMLLYSVPITNPENALINPVVTNEMGKTGTFEFIVNPNHPYYNCWLQMRTLIRVVYDGTTIFRGRVLTIDNTLFGEKKIHCEGDMAFFMDSQQPGTKEEKRSSITILAYLTQIINNHNTQMQEDGTADRVMHIGEVPGNYSNSINARQKVYPDANRKYGSDSWETSLSALEALQKEYGGYFRTRAVESDYIDTIGQYGQGNIDLNNRIVVHNQDGSISTERSFSVNIDNKEVLLPTVINGEIKSEEYAIQYYLEHGEYLGKFDTVSAANTYAEQLHERQDWYYHGRPKIITVYLDWLDQWFQHTTNAQPIEISENLIELQSNSEVENIFTALIPIGSKDGDDIYIQGYKNNIHGNNKRILVPQIVGEYTDDQLNGGYHSKSDYQNAVNRYGIIYKTERFNNADTQAKLWTYACDYIKTNYVGGLTNFNLTALDMHHVNGPEEKYKVGDKVHVTYPDLDSRANGVTPTITKLLTILSVTYNLYNPEKNEYSIGIPNNIISKKYGTSKNKKKSSSNKGKTDNEVTDISKAMDNDRSEYGQLAWRYVINEKYNNAEYQALLAKDPNLQYAPNVLKASKNIIKEILDPTSGRLQGVADSIIMSGGKIEMNADLSKIGILNPTFVEAGHSADSIVINAYNGSIELKQKYAEGQILSDADNPLKTIWQLGADHHFAKMGFIKQDTSQPTPQEILKAQINGDNGVVSNVMNILGLDGSGEQGTIFQNGMSAMLQFFNPSTAGSSTPQETAEINGGNGTGKIGKDTNNGWQVTLNDTITYVDQDGHTQTLPGFVCAKDFNLPEVSSFKTQFAYINTAIIGKASISQLEAVEGRVGTLEATSITTSNLYSSIANLNTVSTKGLYPTNIYCSGNIFYAVGEQGTLQNIKDLFLNRIRLSDNQDGTYSLYQRYNNTESLVGTFSRAISSYSHAWSGTSGLLTITPHPQSTPTHEVNLAASTYVANRVNLQLGVESANIAKSSTGSCGIDIPLYVNEITSATPTTAKVYSKTVNNVDLSSLLDASQTITPSKDGTTVNPTSNMIGLQQVIVSGDNNLVAENIKKDVEIFGVTGEYEGGPTTVSSYSHAWSNSNLVITPHPQETLTHTVQFAASGYTNNDINLQLGIKAANIAKSSTGSYDVDIPLYVNEITSATPTTAEVYTKTVSNISFASLLDDSVEITPSSSDQTVNPGSGKIGLKRVVVKAASGGSGTITEISCPNGAVSTGQERTSGKVQSLGTNISNDPYEVDFSMDYEAFTPSSTSINTAAIYFMLNGVKIGRKADSNLVAGNIKGGVTIFGIQGSYSSNATIDRVYEMHEAISGDTNTRTSLTIRGEGTNVATKEQGYTLQKAVHSDTNFVELLEGTNKPIVVGRISTESVWNSGMTFQLGKMVPFIGDQSNEAYNNRIPTITSNGTYYACAEGYKDHTTGYSNATYDSDRYASANPFTVDVSLAKDTVWTQTTRPTSGTEWPELKGKFKQAIEDGDYCCIRLKLGGVNRIFWCEC